MSQVAGWLGVLRTRSRAFAVLDCVLGGAGDYPTYTFDPQWKPGVALAAMDTGSGDLYAIAFDSIGVFLYGFAHESDLSPWRDNGTKAHWPGLLDGLPPELASYPAEPSFLYEDFFDATVVVWRETADTTWQCGLVELPGDAGPDPDGADLLFAAIADGSTAAYAKHARHYFEVAVDQQAVLAVLDGAPLTAELTALLNPEADFTAIADVVALTGYPVTTI
jgi:hypothetical protein